MNLTPALLPLHAPGREHYLVACRASAVVLARQGHLDQAEALQAEADAAAQRPAEDTGHGAPAHSFTHAWTGALR